jgi:hypothetical protein
MGWDSRGSVAESAEFPKKYMPLVPFLLRREQAVTHVAEKFDFHHVHFLDGDASHFGPSLVRVRIVVEKFVSQHQSYREEPILTSWPPLYLRVCVLQPVDEEQGEQYHVRSHLSGGQDGCHPFAKTRGRDCVFCKRLCWPR